MWQLITQNPDIKDCDQKFSQDERLKIACNTLKFQSDRYNKTDLVDAISQRDQNFLYTYNTNSASLHLVDGFKHPGGWTWNSKVVDLDNDGWQEVINAEGAVRKSGYGWNVLMKNNHGKEFQQKQFSYGFHSDFGLFSFALIDMDFDGDLDIIGNSAEGPVQVYKNHIRNGNHAIAISLLDHKGNSHGIGAKIIVSYDHEKSQQIREIKASGGYMSFDSPVAYFGLGDTTSIDTIKVTWPNKQVTEYEEPFDSNKFYRIERKRLVKPPVSTTGDNAPVTNQ